MIPKITKLLFAVSVIWHGVVVKVLQLVREQQGTNLQNLDNFLKRYVNNTSVEKLLKNCPINITIPQGKVETCLQTLGKNLEQSLEILEWVLQGIKRIPSLWKQVFRRVVYIALIDLKSLRTSCPEVAQLLETLRSLGADVKQAGESDVYTSALQKSTASPTRGQASLLEYPEIFVEEMPQFFVTLAKRVIVQNTWITNYRVGGKLFGQAERILSEEFLPEQGFSWGHYLSDFKRMIVRLQERNEGNQYYQGPGCIKRLLWPEKSEEISGGEMYPSESLSQLAPKQVQEVDILATQTTTDQQAQQKLIDWVDAGESYPSEMSSEPISKATKDELESKGFFFYKTVPEPKEIALNLITCLATLNHLAEVKQVPFQIIATAELEHLVVILSRGDQMYLSLAITSGFGDRELRLIQSIPILKGKGLFKIDSEPSIEFFTYKDLKLVAVQAWNFLLFYRIDVRRGNIHQMRVGVKRFNKKLRKFDKISMSALKWIPKESRLAVALLNPQHNQMMLLKLRLCF